MSVGVRERVNSERVDVGRRLCIIDSQAVQNPTKRRVRVRPPLGRRARVVCQREPTTIPCAASKVCASSWEVHAQWGCHPSSVCAILISLCCVIGREKV